MKKPAKLELGTDELNAFLERIKKYNLPKEDYEIIQGMTNTLTCLSNAIREKGFSIKRLLRRIFGDKTESKKNLFGKNESDNDDHDEGKPGTGTGSKADGDKSPKPKPKGHGRNGVSAFTGADKVTVRHSSLKDGDPCPFCPKGTVRNMKPGRVIRFIGQQPINATIYETEKLRCNACRTVFPTELPPDIKDKKYDETVGAILGLLKYGCGMPFDRMKRLQNWLGMPLPKTTQWDIIARTAANIKPVYEELLRQAAQGDVLYHDDTGAKILDIMKERKKEPDPNGRTGIFTTGILSVLGKYKIGLFFTGKNHAGENLKELMTKRSKELEPPIQMCDALSRNLLPKEFEVILANCLAHARRNFVDVIENFPQECRYVIESLAQVYKNEAITKEKKMSADERLIFHQENSKLVMDKLEEWLNNQFAEKKVEPNSSLGKAISYMLNHWDALTQFLKVPGAPLDNNLCEQVLKKYILFRKNSLFYKTQNGADAGDLFMSLIHTCNLQKINPFHYLMTLIKNATRLAAHPEQWLPWNYQEALAETPP